jgi:putative membrane protein
MALLLKWVLSAASFMIIAYFVDGITVTSFWVALILAVVWGIIAITLKPILLILTLPINILTLGLFTFILNGLLLWFVGGIMDGFVVDGFWTAVLGAFILSILGIISNMILDKVFVEKAA